MALVDVTSWQQYTGVTLSATDATSCQLWCDAVNAAIERMLWPMVVESATVIDILDAPIRRDLLLPLWPVRSIVELQYNPFADGVSSRFDSTSTLTAGTDYELLIDDPILNISRSGIVRRLGGFVWGVTRWGQPGTLHARLQPIRGAIKVTYNVGFPSVPADIRTAAIMAVTQCWNRRKRGTVGTSESWNGYSVSWATNLIADAAVHSPDVLALLRPYLSPRFA